VGLLGHAPRASVATLAALNLVVHWVVGRGGVVLRTAITDPGGSAAACLFQLLEHICAADHLHGGARPVDEGANGLQA